MYFDSVFSCHAGGTRQQQSWDSVKILRFVVPVLVLNHTPGCPLSYQ
jgi:hypothetical protein